MEIISKYIDGGKGFDWGRTSEDYAKFRDIYPETFYQRLIEMGLCVKGQRVLDIGTGTGVLPRNLYKYGAEFIGSDISENQIMLARRLSEEANGLFEVENSFIYDAPVTFTRESWHGRMRTCRGIGASSLLAE